MNPSKQFVFQRWNPQEQKLEQDPDRSALGVEQAQQLLQELGTYCKDHIITKFRVSFGRAAFRPGCAVISS